MIAVVIPTVPGREALLEECVDAYRQTCPLAIPFVRAGFDTCGAAWNDGAEAALRLVQTRYLHFGADDLIPHEGWWQDAMRVAQAGELPAAMLYGPDGLRQQAADGGPGEVTRFSRVPFLLRETWEEHGPIPELHYMSDVWIGERFGLPSRLVGSYAFTHHLAEAGRKHSMDADVDLYRRLTGGQ